jgi:hypothetical protein
MPHLPMPLDPVVLTHLGLATWVTDLIVVQKLGEALWRQGALVFGGLDPGALAPYAD